MRLILSFLAAFLVFTWICSLPTPLLALSDDVRLVLEVAAGENEAQARDAVLLLGTRYLRSLVDLASLVKASSQVKTRQQLMAEGFARLGGTVPERCTLCNGTGQTALGRLCPGCHGAGWTGPMKKRSNHPLTCEFCQGSGQTPLGRPCPLCHGAGLTGPAKSKSALIHPEQCSHCNGTGQLFNGRPCYACHGAGLTGPAKSRSTSSYPETCGHCNGTGTLAMGRPCYACHGSGMTGRALPATGLPAWFDLQLEQALKAQVLRGDNPAARELLEEMQRVKEERLRR